MVVAVVVLFWDGVVIDVNVVVVGGHVGFDGVEVCELNVVERYFKGSSYQSIVPLVVLWNVRRKSENEQNKKLKIIIE